VDFQWRREKVEIYDLRFDGHYHASGHASGEDITWVKDQIDPEHIVPVHTEAREWFADKFENVMLAEEDKRYEF
jgi:ribonuclease J